MNSSLKLSKYFEIIHPVYTYLKIIPHKSNRNYNTSAIAKSMSDTYKSILRRVHREQKKIIIETDFKISYLIDISKDNTDFYFLVPTFLKDNIKEKITQTWSKSTIEEVDTIKEFSNKKIVYQLDYKKDDALSLKINKTTNDPLNRILNVINIMQDSDRVMLAYNFMPCSQFGWREKYDTMLQKFNDKKPLDRHISFEFILKTFLGVVVNTLDTILNVLNDFFNNSSSNDESLYKKVMIAFEEKPTLSNVTLKKKDANIISTQIAVISDSINKERSINNALSVCQSFNVLNEDNELIYRKVNSKFKLDDYSYKLKENLCSVDECKNFIQIPGYELLKEFDIKNVNIEEIQIPEQLRKGYICLGTNTYKGNKIKAFTQDDKDIGSLGLVLLARQGGGKTTYLCNYARYCLLRNENVVHIDFIKNNEASKNIESIVDKNKLIILDLSTEKGIQSFCYNEIKFTPEMTLFEKQALSNKKAEMTIQLVDAINDNGEPLSPKMGRYLSAAANIVYLNQNTTLKDVVKCLQDYEYRNKLLDNLDNKLQEELEEEIMALRELNEINKQGTICGTKDSKIEGILDRVTLLNRDFYLKRMYKKSPIENIDFAEELEHGKVILIRMPQSKFKKYAINVITTFFTTKVWLACELRGEIHDIPLRTHFIVDEISQTKTAERFLESILTQTRKFSLRPVLSLQYLDQLDKKTIYSLKGSGSSFMLLKGAIKEDYEYFKDDISGDFTYEDLKEMSRRYEYPSFNIIQYKEGISTFITELPKPK